MKRHLDSKINLGQSANTGLFVGHRSLSNNYPMQAACGYTIPKAFGSKDHREISEKYTGSFVYTFFYLTKGNSR